MQNPQCRYWMELRHASFDAVRRRLAEYDGEFTFRVIRAIIPTVAKARRRKSLKANLGRISPRHIRVILESAVGKDLAEIARRKIKPRNYFANFKNGSIHTA
jgi:hypothetical protein